jgi:DUF971 family protein
VQAPTLIENHMSSHILELTWEDNTKQMFHSGFLRRQCQCADCKSQRKHPGGMNVSDEVSIRDIRPVGSYAVQLLFSDGHERGIYPWSYLKSMKA